MDTLDIYNTRILHTFIFSILCLFVLLIPKLIGKFNPNLEPRINAYISLLVVIGVIIGGIAAVSAIIYCVYIIITKMQSAVYRTKKKKEKENGDK